jgi:hypothetical protein
MQTALSISLDQPFPDFPRRNRGLAPEPGQPLLEHWDEVFITRNRVQRLAIPVSIGQLS